MYIKLVKVSESEEVNLCVSYTHILVRWSGSLYTYFVLTCELACMCMQTPRFVENVVSCHQFKELFEESDHSLL